MTMRDSKRVADALQAVRDAKNELAAYKQQVNFEHERVRLELAQQLNRKDQELDAHRKREIELTLKYAEQVRRSGELRALVNAHLPFIWEVFK